MDERERVVVLETQMAQVKEDVKEILHNQRQMKEEMTKYKGFIGGVVFLGSCVWAGILLLAKKLGF